MTTEIPNTGIAVVKFGAEWCGPCKVIEKSFEDLSKDINSRSGHEFEGIQFVKIDIDKEQDLAKEYGITAVPTTMVFKDGKNIATKLGAQITPSLSRWIKEALESYS
jgi:thioredoxin 1